MWAQTQFRHWSVAIEAFYTLGIIYVDFWDSKIYITLKNLSLLVGTYHISNKSQGCNFSPVGIIEQWQNLSLW